MATTDCRGLSCPQTPVGKIPTIAFADTYGVGDRGDGLRNAEGAQAFGVHGGGGRVPVGQQHGRQRVRECRAADHDAAPVRAERQGGGRRRGATPAAGEELPLHAGRMRPRRDLVERSGGLADDGQVEAGRRRLGRRGREVLGGGGRFGQLPARRRGEGRQTAGRRHGQRQRQGQAVRERHRPHQGRERPVRRAGTAGRQHPPEPELREGGGDSQPDRPGRRRGHRGRHPVGPQAAQTQGRRRFRRLRVRLGRRRGRHRPGAGRGEGLPRPHQTPAAEGQRPHAERRMVERPFRQGEGGLHHPPAGERRGHERAPRGRPRQRQPHGPRGDARPLQDRAERNPQGTRTQVPLRPARARLDARRDRRVERLERQARGPQGPPGGPAPGHGHHPEALRRERRARTAPGVPARFRRRGEQRRPGDPGQRQPRHRGPHRRLRAGHEDDPGQHRGRGREERRPVARVLGDGAGEVGVDHHLVRLRRPEHHRVRGDPGQVGAARGSDPAAVPRRHRCGPPVDHRRQLSHDAHGPQLRVHADRRHGEVPQ